jgi:hypothetical protein
MKIVRALICVSIALFLGACNSSEGNSVANTSQVPHMPTISLELEGQVIDGYISGAEVCLEHNGSNVCDTTASDGRFGFDVLEFEEDTYVIFTSQGGTDNATQESYPWELQRVFDVANEDPSQVRITPVSDLVARVYNDTNLTLQTIQNNIASAYSIPADEVYDDPLADNDLFMATQLSEYAKALLFTLGNKVNTSSPTQTELDALRADVANVFAQELAANATVDMDAILDAFDTFLPVTSPTTYKNFVIGQYAELEDALGTFTANTSLTSAHRVTYQAELYDVMQTILDIFEAQNQSTTLNPIAIEIDIFTTDTNTTNPDDTNTTDPDDTNTTNPDDTNTTDPVEPTQPLYDLSGVVVDGYIEGATVCVDLDHDRVCDAGEPRTTSASNGSFSFDQIPLGESDFYRVIAFGGTNTATEENFEEEYYGVISTSQETQSVILSPLSDLAARMFFREEVLSGAVLSSVQTEIAASLGLTNTQLLQDPWSQTKTMLVAQELELINQIFLKLVEEVRGSAPSTVEKNFIKDAIYEEYLASGYSGFDVTHAITFIQEKLQLAITDNAMKLYLEEQIGALKTKIAALFSISTFDAKDYKRIELLSNDFLNEVKTNIETNTTTLVDVPLDYEDIVYSKFNKIDALYDENACILNVAYSNSNEQNTTEVRFVDAINGITMGFDETEVTTFTSFTLFYPDIGSVILQNDVDNQVKFENEYYFSYDSAWIDTGKSVYLQAPSDTNTSIDCYRIKLDKLYGHELTPQKVYRYTELP